MIKPNNLEEKIIELALLQHHKPYEHGAHGIDKFDCAGLVWYLYNEVLDIDVYEDGFGQSTTTMTMTSKYGILTLYNELDNNKNIKLIKSGDILFFHRQSLDDNEPKKDNKYPGHCGLYLGDNKFIHAPKKQGKVIISNFEKNKYWVKKLVGFKHII